MGTDLNRWPCLVPLNQQMHAAYPSRDLVAAFFFSILLHVFLALLLWRVTNDRIPVDPVFSSFDAPVIVSLITLPADSDGLDRKSEAKTIVISKDSGRLDSKTPMRTPPAKDTAPSINLDALYSMEWNLGNIPEFKVESIGISIDQGVHASDIPGGNTLSSYLLPSHGLDAFYRFEQTFGEIAGPEFQNKKIKWRIDYMKKYKVLMPPDCRTYYANKGFKGLFVIPLRIKDAVTDSDKACTW